MDEGAEEALEVVAEVSFLPLSTNYQTQCQDGQIGW